MLLPVPAQTDHSLLTAAAAVEVAGTGCFWAAQHTGEAAGLCTAAYPALIPPLSPSLNHPCLTCRLSCHLSPHLNPSTPLNLPVSPPQTLNPRQSPRLNPHPAQALRLLLSRTLIQIPARVQVLPAVGRRFKGRCSLWCWRGCSLGCWVLRCLPLASRGCTSQWCLVSWASRLSCSTQRLGSPSEAPRGSTLHEQAQLALAFVIEACVVRLELLALLQLKDAQQCDLVCCRSCCRCRCAVCVGIGRFLRLTVSNIRLRIPYEDFPSTRRLMAMVQVGQAKLLKPIISSLISSLD